ncbi:MAG: efflux RND transporter periplasmic adaptor subunit [Myxococcota bacterium]
MVPPAHWRLRAALPLVPLLLAGACASTGEGEAAADDGPPAAPVELGKAREGAIEVEHPVLGQVRSRLQAELSAGEPGEVQEVAVREGDRVEEGTTLVLIDPSVARAQMGAAAAQRRQVAEEREQAERDVERFTEAGERLVAGREIEQARSELARLEAREAELAANVQESRAVVSRLRVVAPFDGQVMSRSVDPGDWVTPGDRVITLVAADDVEVLADASPDLVSELQEGDRAELRRGAHAVDAEVRGVVRALERTTRTARVRLQPQEPAAWLLPGSTVEVVFTLRHATEDGAVLVPRDALVMGAVGTRVVRAVDGKAQPVDVEVLVRSAEEALVRGSELDPGEAVVTRGNERLRPGQPLEPLEDDGT